MKKAITVGAIIGLIIAAIFGVNGYLDHKATKERLLAEAKAEVQRQLAEAKRKLPRWTNDRWTDPMNDRITYKLQFRFMNKVEFQAYCKSDTKMVFIDFYTDQYLGRDNRRVEIQYRVDDKIARNTYGASWGKTAAYRPRINPKDKPTYAASGKELHNESVKFLTDVIGAANEQVIVKFDGESRNDAAIVIAKDGFDAAFASFAKVCNVNPI